MVKRNGQKGVKNGVYCYCILYLVVHTICIKETTNERKNTCGWWTRAIAWCNICRLVLLICRNTKREKKIQRDRGDWKIIFKNGFNVQRNKQTNKKRFITFEQRKKNQWPSTFSYRNERPSKCGYDTFLIVKNCNKKCLKILVFYLVDSLSSFKFSEISANKI